MDVILSASPSLAFEASSSLAFKASKTLCNPTGGDADGVAADWVAHHRDGVLQVRQRPKRQRRDARLSFQSRSLARVWFEGSDCVGLILHESLCAE